ncbi:MAG: GIY-YIG nuclease family protein [Chitinophagales bacterium]
MFTVYILYSDSYKKTYVGFTSDLESRLRAHNEQATKGWTMKFRPWRVVYTETFATKSEALKKEKWLKSGVGRDFIKKQMSNW